MANEQGNEEGRRVENPIVSRDLPGMLEIPQDELVAVVRRGDDAFKEAIFETWGRIQASGSLKEWRKEQLDSAHEQWFALTPADPQSATIRERIIGFITDAEQAQGRFDAITSALQAAEVRAKDVREDNATIGKAYEAFSLKWDDTQSNIPRLLQLRKDWKELQAQYNLPDTFNPAAIDSYSSSAIVAFKIVELAEKRLAQQGVTDLAEAEQRYASAIAAEAASSPQGMSVEEQWQARLSKMRDEAEQLRREHHHEFLSQKRGAPELHELAEIDEERESIAQALIDRGFTEDSKKAAQIADQIARENVLRGGRKALEDRESAAEHSAELGKRRELGEDYNTVKQELLTQKNWQEYGWSPEQKNTVQQFIMVKMYASYEAAQQVLAGLVLNGQTGEDIMQRLTDSPIDYLSQFVRNDENIFHLVYRSESDRDAYVERQGVGNIEQLAFTIGHNYSKLFGQDGPLPVLQKLAKRERSSGQTRFQYDELVNTDNLIEWVRDQEIELHGLNPDDDVNFGEQIMADPNSFRPVSVNRMIVQYKDLLKSKYGRDYAWLAGQLEREINLFGFFRKGRIDLKLAGNDEGKIAEARIGLFYKNSFTKPFYKKSMMYWLSTLGEKVTGETRADKGLSDSKVGAASETIFMAYSHLTNPQELMRVLRINNLNELFHLNKFKEARRDLAKAAGYGHPDLLETYYDLTFMNEKVAKAFNPDGSIKTDKNGMKAFIDFINFYGALTPNSSLEAIIRSIVKGRAATIHGLTQYINGHRVEQNEKLAELIAYDMSWVMGVHIKNDVNSAGFHAEQRLNGRYRIKHSKIGGKWGNIKSLGLWKRWLVAPMDGLYTTERYEVRDQQGNVVRKGSPKSVYQVMNEVERSYTALEAPLVGEVASLEREGALTDRFNEKVSRIKQKIAAGQLEDLQHADDNKIREIAEEEVRREVRTELWLSRQQDMRSYDKMAGQFIFNQNEMQDLSLNGYARSFELDKFIRLQELRLDKFVQYVPFVGATLRQEEFQESLTKLITAARYFYKARGVNYDTLVWDWDEKIGEMRLMTMGESLFGEQALNIPEFQNKDGNVNWEYVNTEEGRTVLFKRFVESYVGAQLLAYRQFARWSTNPRYSYALTEDILEILSKIPGELEVDPTDMKNTKVTGSFFNEAAMERIRKESETGKWGMFLGDMFITGLFGKSGKDDGLFSGLIDLASLIFSKSVGELATR